MGLKETSFDEIAASGFYIDILEKRNKELTDSIFLLEEDLEKEEKLMKLVLKKKADELNSVIATNLDKQRSDFSNIVRSEITELQNFLKIKGKGKWKLLKYIRTRFLLVLK